MAKTTGLESIAKGSTKILYIDPREINVREGWNFRDFSNPENAAYIEGMLPSILEGGVREPLTVTWEKGKVWLDDGECRLRAAKLAIERTGKEIRVPVKSEERYANDVQRIINQRIRNSGKEFTVFEDAAFFNHLLTVHKLAQKEIAEQCNISAARVSQILEYNTVGKVGRDLVATGQASASLVMQVTKEEGTDAEKALLNGVKNAKKEGRTKLKPGDVGGKMSVKKAVIDAFEYASIDDSAEDACVVTFPMDKWDVLKDILKL